MFRKMFYTKYNIGFHSPKKDKCRFCSKYENIMIPNTFHEEYLGMKSNQNISDTLQETDVKDSD